MRFLKRFYNKKKRENRMGVGSSSSSGIRAETHDQAFKGTADTRMIMDDLLNYMIKQLSVRDLLHMSKESECKKYVLFKANAIYQYFYELRVFPTTDAKGLLTFRRVEDLVNPKGEQEKERQSLCLIVAYFYTRIFQIYGALALTLMDDASFMTSSGLTSTFLRHPGHPDFKIGGASKELFYYAFIFYLRPMPSTIWATAPSTPASTTLPFCTPCRPRPSATRATCGASRMCSCARVVRCKRGARCGCWALRRIASASLHCARTRSR